MPRSCIKLVAQREAAASKRLLPQVALGRDSFRSMHDLEVRGDGLSSVHHPVPNSVPVCAVHLHGFDLAAVRTLEAATTGQLPLGLRKN
jgi:hypothetical protein